jgi:hypothetical protein
MKTLRSASLAFALALICGGTASAEIVAPGIRDGLLALSGNGAPNVAYIRGTTLVVASRVSEGNWRQAAAASVASGSQVMAFDVGPTGPVALVESGDIRSLALVRRLGEGWQSIRLAGGLPPTVRLGWPGLALDGHGLPVVAYTRWNSVKHDSQLLLVRVDARGRARSQKITAQGFPQSYVPPPAAPVIVKGEAHAIESYGYKTVVGTIEWYPDKKTWTGLFIDVGRGDFPIGPVLAARNSAGTVYAAWTESLAGFGAAPVTLAVRVAHAATSKFVLDRALTTGLALPSSGPEVAANEWVSASDVGLAGDSQVWAGTVVARTRQVEVDGWIAGLAAGPHGRRDVLLGLTAGLAWFRSSSHLGPRLSIAAAPLPDGTVSVGGSVEGVGSGKVTVYRERPGTARTTVGQTSIAGGSWTLVDRSPVEPLLYRAVYTDRTTGIPYAALLRPEPDTISLPGRARRGASGSLNP